MKGLRTSLLAVVLLVVILFPIPSPRALSSEYLLGVGDILRISVWGHPELTTEIEVRPDGYITFPLVGDHWAVDKSSRQLSGELQEILADFVVNPQVTVIIHRFRTLLVQVLGEVRSTGHYELKAGSRLMDVLALAGGPTATADLSRISLTRYFLDSLGFKDQTEVFSVDANEFIRGGSLQANPLLQNGDLIFVPSSGTAAIFGEVRQPASYDLKAGLDLLDLLALAGGALDSAALEEVILTRRQEGEPLEVIVNVEEILSGLGKSVPIQPNDVVFVPKRQQVIVLGAVENPGTYAVKKDTYLVDVLAEAGGVTSAADSRRVSITKNRGGAQEVLVINAFPVLSGQEGGQNPLLSAGDLIFVPEGYYHALVLGQVQRPGSYMVTEQSKILDLLAQAGGTLERAGEKLNLTRNGQTKEIELGALERLGLQNEKVLPGDVIYVPEGQRQVLVLGEVRQPGFYQFRYGDRILDAVGLAGGLLESAQEDQVSLRRQIDEQTTEISTIDFGRLLENRYLQENMPLKGGDVIIVPKSARSVLVLGEVRQPGQYQFRPGDRILEAIGLAGGLLESAREEQVSLRRQIGEGIGEISLIDLGRLWENRSLEENIPLKDGDVIIVPKSERSVLVLGEVRNPGYFVLAKGQKLLDALARAGGFTAEADSAGVALTKETESGWETRILNLADHGAMEVNNIALKGGEIISVPRADRTVLVFGEVVRAGAYVLPPQGKLLDVLALAGGLQVGTEDIILTRQEPEGEWVLRLNYEEVLGAQSELNLPMSGGDVVYVPSSRRQILVLGQVRSPGVYNLPPGARVLDALALAGGPLERAALENVGIYRDGSVEDAEVVAVGRDKILFTGDVSANPLLQGGDIIYVPETKKIDWTKVFSFMGGVRTFQDLIKGFIFTK